MDAGDDAAVLPDGRVVTVDSLVEGVHFRADADPEALGHKVLAVSVSDVLAMGALPDTAFLALSLRAPAASWVDAFAAGLAEACRRWGVHLAGGDTTGSPGPTFLSLTLLGTLPEGRRPWTRRGARPGDRLLVTGTLGDAGGGWIHAEPSATAREALARPEPPLAFVAAVANDRVHAAMDLSDGLAVDLERLCQASGCGARVVADRLPASPEVSAAPDRLLLQTRGGEDYQLLLAVAPDDVPSIRDAAETTGILLTDIGEVLEGAAVELVGAPWPEARFQHFGEGAS